MLIFVFAGIEAFAGTTDTPPEESGKSPAATVMPLTKDDQAALELGHKVQAIQRVLRNPKAPDALKAVTELGHDSRFYVMVRGWLREQLAGDQSILDANKGQASKEVMDRISFLQKAIRAIDLE